MTPNRAQGPDRLAFQAESQWQRLRTWGQQGAARLGAALTCAFGTRLDESFGIFTYHRVAPRVKGLPRLPFNVTPQRFRQQIAGLQQRGYTIRPLAEMLRLRRLGLPLPPRTVVLTFDDGFASVYQHAWPILCDLNAPATIFLCTAFIDTDAPFPFDPWATAFQRQSPTETWRPLRRAECREMLASGLIDLGAHTHTHQDFRLRPHDFAADLRMCRQVLREQFAVEEFAFAFPFGFHNEALMDATRQAGAICALTVDGRLNPLASDPFGWGRFMGDDHDTAGTLAAKREGWYGWLVQRYHQCRRLVGQSREGTPATERSPKPPESASEPRLEAVLAESSGCEIASPPSLWEQLTARGRRWFGATSRKGAVALADQAMVSGVSFLAYVLLGRLRGPEELGLYTMGFSIVVLLYTVLHSVVAAPYTVYVQRMQGLVRRQYRGSVLVHCGILTLAAMAGLTLAGSVGALGFGPPALVPILWTLVVAVPFLLLRELGRRFAFADLQMNSAFALDALVVGLQAALLVGLAFAGRLSAVTALAAAAASCGLAAVGWLWSSRSQFVVQGAGIRSAWRQNWPFAKWVVAEQSLQTLNGYVMPWLLAIMFGVAATGLFSASVVILGVMNPLVLGLNNVLMPRAAWAMSAGEAGELRRVLRKGTLAIGGAVAAFSAVVVLFRAPLLHMLYGDAYAGQEGTVAVLAVDMLVSCLGMAPAYGLWVRERSRTMFHIRLFRVAIAVAVTICLARYLGPIAAAYGLLVGSALGTTLTYLAHRKLLAPEAPTSAVNSVLEPPSTDNNSDFPTSSPQPAARCAANL